eukprot:CAMPEP_0197249764 /NCGR_PEP_ID=MMETSP1429-20130617/49162_1 /TAXON_ID=49237 /ORGANISM="Chaetoceros  sp., Strain UNC1202" /LENGTH=128 /DNA_ID=CAMNT_0042711403 /DNA_START=189 /DNA_END=575 /DNA_ORIENTATION=-
MKTSDKNTTEPTIDRKRKLGVDEKRDDFDNKTQVRTETAEMEAEDDEAVKPEANKNINVELTIDRQRKLDAGELEDDFDNKTKARTEIAQKETKDDEALKPKAKRLRCIVYESSHESFEDDSDDCISV